MRGVQGGGRRAWRAETHAGARDCLKRSVCDVCGQPACCPHTRHRPSAPSAVNGFGLALVIPCVSSMVADLHPPDSRGGAFGMMGLTGGWAAGWGFRGGWVAVEGMLMPGKLWAHGWVPAGGRTVCDA